MNAALLFSDFGGKGTTKNANTQVERAVYQKIIDFNLIIAFDLLLDVSLTHKRACRLNAMCRRS